MHVAIEDHSRHASESFLVDETAECVTQHMIDTYKEKASQGILIKRVPTDNGSEYKSKMFAEACKTLSAKQVFTKPFTPQTNGKAERFMQTLLPEWVYPRTRSSSKQRNKFLKSFIHLYETVA